MKDEQPNSGNLLKRIDLSIPLVGLYDAPDAKPFEPLVIPKPRDCVFRFYKNWINGETLHLTKEHYGCGGVGRALCGVQVRSKEDFIKFLVDDEGLKASYELMEKWIDSTKLYQSIHSHILIGPLREDQWEYLKTITFFINPDQLSTLMIGAQYNSAPQDPPPVIAPFGSGCMELIPFKNLDIAQSSIGATDIAMRQYLPPDILSLTVTKLMFLQLCNLNEKSFLYKSFLQRLRKARGLPGI